MIHYVRHARQPKRNRRTAKLGGYFAVEGMSSFVWRPAEPAKRRFNIIPRCGKLASSEAADEATAAGSVERFPTKPNDTGRGIDDEPVRDELAVRPRLGNCAEKLPMHEVVCVNERDPHIAPYPLAGPMHRQLPTFPDLVAVALGKSCRARKVDGQDDQAVVGRVESRRLMAADTDERRMTPGGSLDGTNRSLQM